MSALSAPRFSKLVMAFVIASLTLAVPAEAKSAKKINRQTDEALEVFREEVRDAQTLINKASGVLVFPRVIKAGIGFGGEYGEGALRIGGTTVAYYSTAAASIGFQLGAQAKTIILMFMTSKALDSFRASDGWEVGVDGSVALVTVGAGGSVDTTNLKAPIIGFVLDQKGLMYNLTLEESKISRIDR